MMASEDLLQVGKRELFDLQGQIDTLNTTEVIHPTTKASWEETVTYMMESFEDCKTFQWTS